MIKLNHTTLAATAIGAGVFGSAALAGEAYTDTASSPARLISGVYTSGNQPALLKAQFLWAGRNYCFYDDAWNGPGFYWCGYAWHRGWGWGGPEGWHGWNRGYRGGGYYHGGDYSHGGGYYRGGGRGGWGDRGGYNRGGSWGDHRGGAYHGSGGHGGGRDGGHDHGGH